MKAITPILLLSLAANVALATWLLRPAAPVTVNLEAAPAVSAAPPAVAPAALAPGPQTWAQLDAASDAELVARLRAEGFPPSMMYALFGLRQQERYAGQLKKFRPSVDYPYWRRSAYEDDLSPEDRAARRALYRRMDEERRQVLGPDADMRTIAERANSARQYGNVSLEKAEQITAINRDYNEVAALVRDRTKGVTLPEDREQLVAIEREKRADLVKLLTPAELFEYDLRSSSSASRVRGQLRSFEPTEEEYRALTALQMGFDATYGDNYNLSGEQQQRRTEAAAELTAHIKALLPPDRYAEYEIKTDPTYSSAAFLASRHGLPLETAGTVVGAQRDLAARYNALRNDRSLDPAVRNAQLDALSAEANTRMAGILGPEALAEFKRNGGPINSLLNRPAPKR